MYRNQRPPSLHRRADLASIRTVRSHATATVSVKYETKLGESLKLVGSNSNWDPNAPQSEMTWSSGHVWSRTVEADASTTVEFKLVVVGNKGQAQWENGDNRVITIPSSPLPSPILVNCLFGNTKEMKVVVPEIPPQISAIKAAASVKAEEVVTGVKQQQELGSGKVDKAKNVEANPSASIGETPGPSSPVSKEAQAASGEVATDAVQVEGVANQGFPVGVVFAVVTLGAAALYLKFNPLANLTDASNLASSFMVAARDKVTSGI